MRTSSVLLALVVVSACTAEPADHDASTADTGTNADSDTDAGADAPDVGVTDADGDVRDGSGDAAADAADDIEEGGSYAITVPFGETLFFDGDDYLAFWGADTETPVTVTERPDGATAVVADRRLTPDVAGEWVLQRDKDTVTVSVRADTLDADTFLNFNYTPNVPLVVRGADLWAALPPANAVHRIADVDGTLSVVESVATGSWPVSLAWWPGGELLLVSQAGRDSIGLIDTAVGRVIDAIPVGDEPASIIVDGDVAYVAVSGESRVKKVDLLAREVVASVDVGRDTRALTLSADGSRLFAASLVSSNRHPMGRVQEELVDDVNDIAVIDLGRFEVEAYVDEVGTIIRGLWIDPALPQVLVAAVSHSHNDVDEVAADARPHRHGLALIDIDSESETAWQVTGTVDLDTQETSTGPAPSPFSMRVADDDHLLVTLSAGNAVLVLDRTTFAEVDRIPVGSDPRGLVPYADGFATLSWAEARVDAFGWPGALETPEVTAVELPGDPTPDDIREGRRMFNDAAFSKHNDFSCNNCHIDGLTDGLTWNLLLDGDVNTISFRNVGGTGPFLWGGQLPTLFDFSREVLQLVGADASGRDMQLLTTYMQSVTAPPNPNAGPGGVFTEAGERGETVFAVAGCISCHNGPVFTNRTSVDGKTSGLRTDVPGLIGVYDSAPYGRQGHWSSLEEMVEYAANHFLDNELDEAQLADLEAYVSQIPGDLLYLNSASPLDGATHVWTETSIELAFSGVLVPGQLDAFSFRVYGDDPRGVPVPGTWSQSGRYVRFEPDEPLARETEYGMLVAAGVTATLGQRTVEPFRVRFETGAVPGTDVSGDWDLVLSERDFGSATVTTAFIQSRGGKVTGVAIDDFEEGGVDHLEGVVSGMTLSLDPFTVQTDFGNFFVADGVDVALADENDDGFADTGSGVIFFEFGPDTYEIHMDMTRISLPDEE